MKRTSRTFAVVVTAGLLLVGTAISPAVAAPKSDKGKVTTLVTYTDNRSRTQVDYDSDGSLELGDIIDYEYSISLTPGGETIGVSYSQGDVIAYKPESGMNTRRVEIQKKLPGGDVFLIGLSVLPAGTSPQPGWQASYAIIGGTGKYEGARGSDTYTLLPDGRTFESVMRLLK
jgi:hypothetical protein